MSFRIVVTEVLEGTNVQPVEIERYRQTVDVIDLKKIIDATNYKPRGPRAKKGEKA